VKHFLVPQLYGIVKDYPARFIPENKCQDGLNIMFKEGRVSSRWGYFQFGDQLNGEVLSVVQYDLLRTSVKHIVAFTTTDVYKWETASAGAWKYITKSYNTGTVTLSASTTVVGDGTAWEDLTGTPASWYIGFGSDDINSITTWYSIDSITDDTHLELSSAWTGATGVSIDYVIRQCFSGDSDNFFSIAFPYDTDETEKILVATNGIDPIVKWTGTGVMEDLGGASGLSAKYIGYFGAIGYEHTYIGNVIDSGTALPQAVYVSETGDPEDWPGIYYDLLTSEDEIKGMASLGTSLIIYKARSITEAWSTPAGGSADPLDFNQNKIKDVGTPSIRTVCDLGQYHIFMGWDNIYLFDGIQVIPIGTEIINTMLSEMNRDQIDKCFAVLIRGENLYCLFVPTDNDYCDKVYVYNYQEKTWSIWTLYRNIEGVYGLMTCGGKAVEQTAETWDSWLAAGYTWEDIEGRWDCLNMFSDDVYFLGDKDGYVYKFAPIYTTDNGTDFTATITTRDYPLNDMKYTVRLNELVIGLIKQSTGDIEVRCSVDFGANWSDWTTISMIDTENNIYMEQIANFVERGKQVRFEIRNSLGSYFEIESLLIGYNDAGITR